MHTYRYTCKRTFGGGLAPSIQTRILNENSWPVGHKNNLSTAPNIFIFTCKKNYQIIPPYTILYTCKHILEFYKLDCKLLPLISGLYFKYVTIIIYASSSVNNLRASVNDNARVIIYDRHKFIVQATGAFVQKFFFSKRNNFD